MFTLSSRRTKPWRSCAAEWSNNSTYFCSKVSRRDNDGCVLLTVSVRILTIVVFSTETKNFVELLFKTLETQEYVLPPLVKQESGGSETPPTGVIPVAPMLIPEGTIDTAMPLVSVPECPAPSVQVQVNGSTGPLMPVKRETRKSDSEKDDKEKEKRSRSR